MAKKAMRSVRFGAVIILVLGIASVSAQPLSVPGTLVKIYPPEEVLKYCRMEGEHLILEFPGARPWVLDTTDSLSAMPADEVVRAIEQMEFPIDGIPVDVVILPFARKLVATSSAEGRVIFLSPGRIPVPPEHVHYTVCHEFGHIIHKAFMPDSRVDLWQRYAEIRGLSSTSFDATIHHERIHEIFAEDFRVLFGSPLARNGGEVENHDLASPMEVPGLREFMLSLALSRKAAIIAYPNPFTSLVVLSLEELVGEAHLEIYNVEGKLVRSMSSGAQGSQVIWDGRSQSGEKAAPGVYLVIWAGKNTTRVIKLIKTGL